MFRKILIANRGEIALRVIRACREMRISTVAVYSQADTDSLHVRLADEAVCIGPPPSKDSYLNMPNVISAAVVTGAEAIHPGYGYFSESPSFAEACEACKLTFIGPKASSIERMGDKARAREIMQGAGVPTIPGSKGVLSGETEALRLAAKLGYPVRIKAAAGGGGRGIRVVHSEEDLPNALKLAVAEAESAFGVPDVYLEKDLEEPRHIEVQVLADQHGCVVHLGERECSIQHGRSQKLIEESPSPAVDPHLRSKMGEAAIRAAKAVGYSNAGTVEFLLDRDGSFYFMEMNTRIQVEHPVTEAVTGIDIVKEQIRVAAGEKLGLAQKDIKFRGHAIECRITAEDADKGFTPAAGRISQVILPGGLGVRMDTHIYAGYQVPPYYDSLLAKLIVWGKDRSEAIIRMSRALSEFQVDGITTNIEWQRRVMSNSFFRKGDISTSFISRRMGEG